jgi:putative ABC transport system permease protein
VVCPKIALSASLIVSTIIVYKQTRFLNDKDLGFNKEQILYFQIRGDVEKNLETFKSELRRSPNIVSVTSGYGLPGTNMQVMVSLFREKRVRKNILQTFLLVIMIM